jgi:hypothetical protein
MINISEYFPNLKNITVVLEMTGWVPPYLCARNILKHTNPDEGLFVPNFENIDNIGDSDNCPLYKSYFCMDHPEEIIEDFKFSYSCEEKEDFRNIKEDTNLFVFSHPITIENFEREGVTVLSGDPPILDISGYDNKFVAAINLTADGWMYTYWHFLTHYKHDWENSNFNEHEPIVEPLWDVFEQLFTRITSYYTDDENIYNDIFKFGKEKFLFIDYPSLICDKSVTNFELFQLYNKVVGYDEEVPETAYHDDMFNKYRQELFSFLETKEVIYIKEQLERRLPTTGYYKAYENCNIIGVSNYKKYLTQ